MSLFENILTTGLAIASGIAHRELVVIERDEACRRIRVATKHLNTQQFDDFESGFLGVLSTLVDPQKKVRAYEVYAYLKIVEIEKFSQYRGFGSSGEGQAATIFENIVSIGFAAPSDLAYRQLANIQRGEACKRILSAVKDMNAEEFDSFEAELLNAFSTFVDVDKKVRAAELYSYAKIVEVEKFGQFRGFCTPGHALR